MTELDDTDIKAALFVVSDYLRHRPSAPPSLHRLRDKLNDVLLSPRGQETPCATPSLTDVEWVGTRFAARILGWHPRRVRRHQADLGGRLIGQRLVFDARAVRDYARGLEQ